MLRGISLSVGPGECIGLLGANGSGKSTVVALIAGTQAVQSGHVSVGGHSVANDPRGLRRDLGAVFQQTSLDPKLSVYDNLILTARLYRTPLQRVADELARVHLEERRDDQVRHLSGGMRRKLDLARALMCRPKLLLLDEPTSGLDAKAHASFWDEIEKRKQQGLSILLATHQPEEAARCDRLMLLHEGAPLAEGSPEELVARIAGDIVVIESAHSRDVADKLSEHLGLAGEVRDDCLYLEVAEGHKLIPRIIEALPGGYVDSVSMHKPTLSDVFLKLSGVSLQAQELAA